MKYHPRKHRAGQYSRVRPRNISVRLVLRENPDLEKLARAFIQFAQEESARTAMTVSHGDALLSQPGAHGLGGDIEPISDASKRPA